MGWVSGGLCPPRFIHWSCVVNMCWMWLYGAFKEVIKVKWGHRGGPNPIWQVSLWEEEMTQTHTEGWPCGDTGRRRPSTSQERGLGRNRPADTLILGLQFTESWDNKYLSFEPPRLWCLVTAALTNSEKMWSEENAHPCGPSSRGLRGRPRCRAPPACKQVCICSHRQGADAGRSRPCPPAEPSLWHRLRCPSGTTTPLSTSSDVIPFQGQLAPEDSAAPLEAYQPWGKRT